MRRGLHNHADWIESSRRAARLLRDREVWKARSARALVWAMTLGSVAGALRPFVSTPVFNGSLVPGAAAVFGLGVLAALFCRWWSDNRGQKLEREFDPEMLAPVALETGDFALGMRAKAAPRGIVLERAGGLGYALRATVAVVVFGLACLAAGAMVLLGGAASAVVGILLALVGLLIPAVWLRCVRLLRLAVTPGERGFTAEVRALRWGVAPRTSTLTGGVGFIEEAPGVLLAVAPDGATLCLTDYGGDPWMVWEVRRLAATFSEAGHPVEATHAPAAPGWHADEDY